MRLLCHDISSVEKTVNLLGCLSFEFQTKPRPNFGCSSVKSTYSVQSYPFLACRSGLYSSITLLHIGLNGALSTFRESVGPTRRAIHSLMLPQSSLFHTLFSIIIVFYFFPCSLPDQSQAPYSFRGRLMPTRRLGYNSLSGQGCIYSFYTSLRTMAGIYQYIHFGMFDLNL